MNDPSDTNAAPVAAPDAGPGLAPPEAAPSPGARAPEPPTSDYDQAQDAEAAAEKAAEKVGAAGVRQDGQQAITADGNAQVRDNTFVTNQQVGTNVEHQVNNYNRTRVTNVERAPKDRPIRDPIDPTEPEKLEQVFVKPKSFDEQKEKLAGATRIVIVHGPESSGRYAVALRLGALLLGKKPTELVWFRPVASKTRTVKEVVASIEPKAGGVYVIRDAFGTDGLNAEQFRNWHEANKLLKGAWLLVTATTEAAKKLPLDLERIESGEVDMAAALGKHVAWYESGAGTGRLPPTVAKLVRDDLTNLAKLLSADRGTNSPVKADLFCRRVLTDTAVRAALADGAETKLPAALAAVARQIAAGDPEAAARWFAGLNRNARLFALLLGLFAGVRRSLLEQLYEVVARHLRGPEELEYDDPREYGLDDLYRDLNVRPEKMEFADPAFAAHVEAQTQNYAPLLMSLLGVVLLAVRSLGGRDDWALRLRIGQFAGRYGVPQFERLRDLMDDLAEDRSGRVSVIAAHAAAELALRTTQHDPELLAGLSKWIDSGDADRVWTAAVALQRLYPIWKTDPDRSAATARQLVTRLAERSQDIAPRFEERVRRDEQNAVKRLLKYDDGADWGSVSKEEREAFNPIINGVVRERVAAALTDCAVALVRTVTDGVFAADPDEAVKLLQEWLAPDPLVKDEDEDEDEDDATAPKPDAEATPEAKADADAAKAPDAPAAAPQPATTAGPKAPGAKAQPERAEVLALRRRVRRLRGAEAVLQLFLDTRTGPGAFDALAERHAALLRLLPDVLGLELDPVAPAAEADESALTDTVLRLEEVDRVQAELVEPVLRVLAGWLRYGAWRPRVAGALLGAINRSTPRQRQRLRRGLLHTWLRDDRETRELPPEVRTVARQFAEGLLLRERLLGGAISDFPGGGRGLLFVDASREGRPGGSAVDLVAETYHRLRAQTDLTVGWLGRRELFTPTEAQLTHDRIRPGHHHPRLLLPALADDNFADPRWKDNAPFTEADVHFVLVPHWGQLTDGADVLLPPGDQAPDATQALWKDRLIAVPLGGNLNAVVDLQDDLDDLTPEVLAKIREQNPELAYFLERGKNDLGMQAIRAVRDNRKNLEWLFDFWLHPLVEAALAGRLVARPPERWRALMATTPGLPPASPAGAAEFLAAAVEYLKTGARELDELAGAGPQPAGAGRGRAPDRVRSLLCVLQGVAAHDLAKAVGVVVGWFETGNELGRTLGIAAARAVLRVRVDTRLDRDRNWTGAIDPVDPVFAVFALAPGLAKHELAPYPGLAMLLRAARALSANLKAARRLLRAPDAPEGAAPPTGLVAAAKLAAKDRPDLRDWLREQLSRWDRVPVKAAAPTKPAPPSAPNRPARPVFDPFGRDKPKPEAPPAATTSPAPAVPGHPEGVTYLADRLAGHLRQPAHAIAPDRHYGVLLLDAASGQFDHFAKELQKVLEPALPAEFQLLVFRVGGTRPVASGRKSPAALAGAFTDPRKCPARLIGPIFDQAELFARVRFAVLLASELPMDFEEARDALDERRLVDLTRANPDPQERSRYAAGFVIRERDDPTARACGWELVLCPNLANPPRSATEAARFADRFIFPLTGRRTT